MARRLAGPGLLILAGTVQGWAQPPGPSGEKAHPARTASPPRGAAVLVDPRTVDLSSVQVQAAVLKAPADRTIIPLLTEGETPFATRSRVFRQMARYRSARAGGPERDAVKAWAAAAETRGLAAYGLIDCLQWVGPAATPSGRVRFARNDLLELTQTGDAGDGSHGLFASPFHPPVREALEDLIRESIERYPSLSGLVLRFQLPTDTLYGFHPSARAAYIRDRGIDPIDITLAETTEIEDLVSELTNWRLTRATAVVESLCTTARRRNPRLKLAVVGTAGHYRQPLRDRGRSLNDWMSWVTLEGVDEVLLEADWGASSASDTYPAARALMAKARSEALASAVVPLRAGRRRLDAGLAFRTLRLQGCSSYVATLANLADIPSLASLPARRPAEKPKD